MKKIKVFSLSLMLMLLLDNLAFAETSICVIDVDKLVFESKIGKNLSNKLQIKITNFQNKFKQKEKELEGEKNLLQKKRDLISKESYDNSRKIFEKKVIDFQSQAQEERSIIENLKTKGLEKIDKILHEIIADLSKANNYAIVVPISMTLYHEKKIDITNEVMEKLNSKIQKVEID